MACSISADDQLSRRGRSVSEQLLESDPRLAAMLKRLAFERGASETKFVPRAARKAEHMLAVEKKLA